MAAPAVYNLKIFEGSRFYRALNYKDGAGVTVPLAGYSGELTIKETYDGAALLTLSESSGLTFADTSPNIEIEITDAETDALGLDGEVGVYTLEIWGAGVQKQQIFRGDVRFYRRATIWT